MSGFDGCSIMQPSTATSLPVVRLEAGHSSYSDAEYPSFNIPCFVPLTVPAVRNSSEARKSSRWFLSHAALWDEHARSAKTLFGAPRSVYRSRTRSGGTCLSCAPATTSIGTIIFPTAAWFHPHTAVCGARLTPVPQVDPTGSDARSSDHTESPAARSY